MHPILNHGFVHRAHFSERIGDVLPDIEEVKDGSSLEDIGDTLAQLQQVPFVHAGQVLAFEDDIATVRFEQTHDQLQGDAFPAAALAQDPQRFSPLDLETDASDDRMVELLVHVEQLDGWLILRWLRLGAAVRDLLGPPGGKNLAGHNENDQGQISREKDCHEDLENHPLSNNRASL